MFLTRCVWGLVLTVGIRLERTLFLLHSHLITSCVHTAFKYLVHGERLFQIICVMLTSMFKISSKSDHKSFFSSRVWIILEVRACVPGPGLISLTYTCNRSSPEGRSTCPCHGKHKTSLSTEMKSMAESHWFPVRVLLNMWPPPSSTPVLSQVEENLKWRPPRRSCSVWKQTSGRKVSGLWHSSQKAFNTADRQVCKLRVNVMEGLRSSYLRSTRKGLPPPAWIKCGHDTWRIQVESILLTTFWAV